MADGNSTVYLGATRHADGASVGDVATAIDLASGVTDVNAAGALTSELAGQTAATIAAGVLTLKTGRPVRTCHHRQGRHPRTALGLTASLGAGDATVSAARRPPLPVRSAP